MAATVFRDSGPAYGSPLYNLLLINELTVKDKQDVYLYSFAGKVNDNPDVLPVAICLRFGAKPYKIVNYRGKEITIGTYYREILTENGVNHQTRKLVSQLFAAVSSVEIGRSGFASPIRVDCESSIIGLLLDRPEMVGKVDKELVVKSMGREVLIKFIPNPKKVKWNYLDHILACNYYNVAAFKKCVNKGLMPSYPLLSRMLIRAKSCPAQAELIAMVDIAVKSGVDLDYHQEKLYQDIVGNPSQQDDKPFWKKICSGDIAMSPGMKRLSIMLNIPDYLDKTVVCQRLRKLASLGRERLIELAHRQSLARFNAEMRYAEEYGDDDGDELESQNVSRVYEYGQLDISYYRDNNGKIWVFLSNQYSELIKTGFNPDNKTKLPDHFIKELKYKLAVFDNIALAPRPSTITESVGLLYGTKQDFRARQYIELLLNQAPSFQKLEGISPARLKEILNDIGIINIEWILETTREHAAEIGAWIALWMYANEPVSFRKLINLIEN